jgi:hypothetical protein
MKYKEIENLYEMANLVTRSTGLKGIMWVFTKTGKEKHWARVKYTPEKGKEVIITISNNPEVISKVRVSSALLNDAIEWVRKNEQVLMQYWQSEGRMDLQELLNGIQKV